jgi:nitroimidazol reductase NimA-like FMN-containing flavoprotein (pyridoxamine 5'-phosphate oxidase superfamily)
MGLAHELNPKDTPMNDVPPSPRTAVKRLPNRAAYDADTIHRILDEGLFCNVAFVLDGQASVIPTLYVRLGDHVYLHGSPASRMLRTLAEGETACLTVTLVDGLVLARSAFHHSMNYRSVVLYGKAAAVEEPEQKMRILHALSDHIVVGRWMDVRVPTADELRRTMVVGVPIDEASAKIRTGPPLDDEEDYTLPIWAGVVPLHMAALTPVPDARVLPGVSVPPYALAYKGPSPVS